ncbi:hypothetical protein BCR37DRAFT_121825 [Protomyces lactucae-debilis]|uniref:Uncharacterized protein n=1 Tax=Protomyces lactucae-debilis TaxID=2754530 RepID=A0A1Y2F1J8_PROLT|nr:uncharacterized protein BCR37DRAFT_121825 [Protomyces lactucae-debilis]ORY77761.1 hypothetical protein BCR37DRAFT_121825 [Protomyces lactucae-debilis]
MLSKHLSLIALLSPVCCETIVGSLFSFKFKTTDLLYCLNDPKAKLLDFGVNDKLGYLTSEQLAQLALYTDHSWKIDKDKLPNDRKQAVQEVFRKRSGKFLPADQQVFLACPTTANTEASNEYLSGSGMGVRLKRLQAHCVQAREETSDKGKIYFECFQWI